MKKVFVFSIKITTICILSKYIKKRKKGKFGEQKTGGNYLYDKFTKKKMHLKNTQNS